MLVAFALILTVVAGAVGLAIDYSRMARLRSLSQQMIDTAALAAVRDETLEAARTTFNAHIDISPINELGTTSIAAQVVSFDGDTLVASAQIDVRMTFAALLGRATAQMNLQTKARRAGGHQELVFALDLSGSLGVGATEADRAQLEALTAPYTPDFYGTRIPQGCAFGCHRREGWEPGSKTVYEMARDAGIKLREDELIGQFGGLVDLLLDPADAMVLNGYRKVSVIGFSSIVVPLITRSVSASDVMSSLGSYANSNRYETNYATAFSFISNQLGSQGDGTAGNPHKTLILITDGINSRDAFFAQSALDTSLCAAIKNKGFRLAVVELKYPKLLLNDLYDDTVLPVETAISPALEQCASPGWYFQAVNHDDIPPKFAELKEKISSPVARLTE